jgi:hypothetical protein
MSAVLATFRRSAVLILMASLVGLAGCYKGASGRGGESMVLLVQNRGFYDVNVFAVRSAGVAGRRLGTANGNSTATLRVPLNDLQPGGTLVVSLRSVGGRFAWTSMPLQMSSGVVARLDIVQTGNGDLSQSQLYGQYAQPSQDR